MRLGTRTSSSAVVSRAVARAIPVSEAVSEPRARLAAPVRPSERQAGTTRRPEKQMQNW